MHGTAARTQSSPPRPFPADTRLTRRRGRSATMAGHDPDAPSRNERVSKAPRRNAPPKPPAATASGFQLSAGIPALARWASPAAYVLIGVFAAALALVIAGPHSVGDVFT